MTNLLSFDNQNQFSEFNSQQIQAPPATPSILYPSAAEFCEPSSEFKQTDKEQQQDETMMSQKIPSLKLQKIAARNNFRQSIINQYRYKKRQSSKRPTAQKDAIDDITSQLSKFNFGGDTMQRKRRPRSCLGGEKRTVQRVQQSRKCKCIEAGIYKETKLAQNVIRGMAVPTKSPVLAKTKAIKKSRKLKAAKCKKVVITKTKLNATKGKKVTITKVQSTKKPVNKRTRNQVGIHKKHANLKVQAKKLASKPSRFARAPLRQKTSKTMPKSPSVNNRQISNVKAMAARKTNQRAPPRIRDVRMKNKGAAEKAIIQRQLDQTVLIPQFAQVEQTAHQQFISQIQQEMMHKAVASSVGQVPQPFQNQVQQNQAQVAQQENTQHRFEEPQRNQLYEQNNHGPQMMMEQQQLRIHPHQQLYQQ